MVNNEVKIVRADITRIRADIIVNTANVQARCGNGVDRAIFTAAGKTELLKDRKNKNPSTMSRAEVFVTDSYKLKKNGVKYIFHTLSTFWINGKFKEEYVIRDCYRNCLNKAREIDCKSIAFPIIGSGSFGCPPQIAMKIAHDECWDFVDSVGGISVILVVYSEELVKFCRRYSESIREEVSEDEVKQGIEAEYLLTDDSFNNIVIPETIHSFGVLPTLGIKNPKKYICDSELIKYEHAEPYMKVKLLLNRFLMYGEKMGYCKTDSEVYRRADMPRNTFSDLKNEQKKFMPSKASLLRLIIGLKLDIYAAELLLETAGYSFGSSKTDQIIKKYIINHEDDYIKLYDKIGAEDPNSILFKKERRL